MPSSVTGERLRQENLKKADEIRKKSDKTPEQVYEEREKRVRDAIQLREPDRVPVRLETHSFPARYAGVPIAAAYYDPAVWKEATKKTVLDFEPDIYQGTVFANSGETLELLDPKHLAWPGGTLPPDVAHQNIEQEYMKEEEYDLFLSDPTDYTLRYLLPRAFGGLGALTRLPYLADRFTGFPGMTSRITGADMQELGKTLLKAGQAQSKAEKITADFSEEMALLGFPPASHGGGAGGAPFDSLSDIYRGMRGAMIDMYRCPDKLLAACDQIVERRIAAARPADPAQRGNPKRVFVALHRGAEGFMSIKQFEKFYWPGLKRALLCTIEMGIVPIIFCEGQCGDRLEYFLELPKGKAVCLFEQTDMVRAKEVLRDHVCIAGNVPASLLQVGSVQDVEEYCARLIKACGKGGGFILSAGSSIDEAKPANIKAMVDSPRKFRVN
ncbi:MAG: uroporphyrinogen decarboxylase family protein [Dehalococcoidales bacterium]